MRLPQVAVLIHTATKVMARLDALEQHARLLNASLNLATGGVADDPSPLPAAAALLDAPASHHHHHQQHYHQERSDAPAAAAAAPPARAAGGRSQLLAGGGGDAAAPAANAPHRLDVDAWVERELALAEVQRGAAGAAEPAAAAAAAEAQGADAAAGSLPSEQGASLGPPRVIRCAG